MADDGLFAKSHAAARVASWCETPVNVVWSAEARSAGKKTRGAGQMLYDLTP